MPKLLLLPRRCLSDKEDFPSILRPKLFSLIPEAIGAQEIRRDHPGLFRRQRPRAPKWHGFLNIRLQLGRGRETPGKVYSNQWRHIGRKHKPLIIGLPPMTTACPAVRVFRRVSGAKFIRQALTTVAVTRHTPQPVDLRPTISLGRLNRQGRLSQAIWRRRRRRRPNRTRRSPNRTA